MTTPRPRSWSCSWATRVTSSRPGRCPLKRPECSPVRAPPQASLSPPAQPLCSSSRLPSPCSCPGVPYLHRIFLRVSQTCLSVTLCPSSRSHHLPQGCLYGQLFVVDFKAGHSVKLRDPGCDRCAPHDLLQSRFPQEASGVRGSKMQWLRVQVPWPSLMSPGQSFVQSLCAAGLQLPLARKGIISSPTSQVVSSTK